MNCPVCKNEIEFELPKEDIYYDCPHCQSSLFFSNGECQVIHSEQIEPLKSEAVETENDLKEIDNSQTDQNPIQNLEENTESLSKEKTQKIETSSMTNLSENNFNSKKETESFYQTIKEEKEESEIQNLANKQENITNEENRSEEEDNSEEDFFPDEETKVPELPEELEKPTGTDSEIDESSDKFEEEEIEEPSYKFEEESEKTLSINSQEENTNSSSANEKPAEDFSEVAEFAKNQAGNTKNLYIYDLTLSQINSQELKEEVLAVLEDSYLNLEIEDSSFNLEDVVNKGEIKIPKISPVQTYIIVKSLFGLPLNIHWKQHHIADK